MTTASPRRGLLSLDDWRALGEDTSQRYELVEGVLLMSPSPRLEHQDALTELVVQLSAQRHPGFRITLDSDVILQAATPPTVRRPDLMLRRADAKTPLTAADVILAIEILSPGTRRMDLVMKRSEYADAGIEHYWIVDPDDHTMEALRLVDGAYVGDHVTGTFTTTTPFPLTIDLDALG